MSAIAILREVVVRRSGRIILGPIDLEVPRREHLAILGPNGAGKTTLLRLLSTYLHPTAGQVEVLGGRFGRIDLRELRPRIGVVTVALDHLLGATFPAGELVAAARRGATTVVRGGVDDADRSAARRALDRVGAGALVERTCNTLSQGEWQRVKIARALVTDPDLLLLDEPFAGLDLGGREALVADLGRILDDLEGPTVVLITHHLEELPTGIRRALLLLDGGAVAAGPGEDVLTHQAVSETFGVPVRVERAEGRWTARVTLSQPSSVPISGT
jgi:iron complex transport system ATP-binding protein